MTAAPEIPADVTASAREVVVAYIETHSGKVHSSFRQQVDAGQFDDWPIYLVAARAILAERQRAADIADGMSIPFAAGRPRAEAHNAACRVISRAIQGQTA